MWAIAAIASLAILFTLLLYAPLDLKFHTSVYRKPKSSIRLVWLFGLVSKELKQTKKEPEANRVIEHKQKRGDWTQEIRAISEFLRIKGFLRQLVSFLKRIVRRIKIKKLIADFKIGLENPADIGLLFAFLAPLNLLMSYFSPHHIRIEPSFTSENIIEGHFDGELRLRPIQLAVPLIGFAFSLPTLRAIKKLVFSKWKRKE